jgi:hypothetical protein
VVRLRPCRGCVSVAVVVTLARRLVGFLLVWLFQPLPHSLECIDRKWVEFFSGEKIAETTVANTILGMQTFVC